MLTWINNNYGAILIGCTLIALATAVPISIYFLVSAHPLKNYFVVGWIISISLLFSVLVSGYLPGNFGKAIRGEYGQKWVITSKFEANKSPKQLQKILKNNDGENNFATYDIRVWHRGKEYSGINIKSKEGNNKIVFSYLEPTMKGIKVNKNKAYIYIYHKKAKPQPKVFKYGEE